MFEAGRLKGTGGFGASEQSRAATWTALGLLARLAVGVAGPLRLEVEVGAFAPLRTDRFHLTTAQGRLLVWQTPNLGGFAGLSLGVSFW